MSNWTVSDIPDQSNKTILITGANSGIGLGAAKELAKKGATLILAVRNLQKGKQAAQEIAQQSPLSNIEVMQLDLSDLESVKQLSTEVAKRYNKLDILINNAGIMMPNEKTLSKQGYEIQLATNHLGHFLLTKELLPLLEKSSSGRVVTLSSLVAAMNSSDIFFSDLNFDDNYHKMKSYGQSKLANIMFSIDLDKNLNNLNHE